MCEACHIIRSRYRRALDKERQLLVFGELEGWRRSIGTGTPGINLLLYYTHVCSRHYLKYGLFITNNILVMHMKL